MPDLPCIVCAQAPALGATLCLCGFELRYHTLGHPHGFANVTPSCAGFQTRQAAVASPAATQLPLLAAAD